MVNRVIRYLIPHAQADFLPYRIGNGYSVAWRMVVEGCGLGITHISHGDSEPRVSRILKELPTITYPVWLVTHEEIKDTPRIRYIYDLITEQFNKV
tara:strand:- start:76 stop:363 length:288 start_codon:yes stop_codon:yes gene_type:complete